MDYNWIWETVVIFFIGKIILRMGGRKSISQMTITQTIVMIGVGSLIIQPLGRYDVWTILLVTLLLTMLMVVSEYVEMKVDAMETLFSGKAVIVVENGQPNMKNMKKFRLTVDRLETRLRQNGISSIEDVQTATIEVSGQIGYEMKDNKKPLTKEDFLIIMAEITELKKIISGNAKIQVEKNKSNNIFDEIKKETYEGNKNEP